MAKAVDTRQQIMNAALRRFAEQGYAGTSVQEIVDDARVTKPSLYYHFRNKADLYHALVERAFEERHRLMLAAVGRGGTIAEQLTEICAVLFKFVGRHRDLMRMAFATSFAARGEVPDEAGCFQKGLRNFEYLRGLFTTAVTRGDLNRDFDAEELAMGFVGLMHLHIMAYLIKARGLPNRRTAERMVKLYLTGARPV